MKVASVFIDERWIVGTDCDPGSVGKQLTISIKKSMDT